MKHTLSILLQNESGALVRVAQLFAARHVNINALSVAPTEDDPATSLLTLDIYGSNAALQQIVRQLHKLVDVLEVEALPDMAGKGPDARPGSATLASVSG